MDEYKCKSTMAIGSKQDYMGMEMMMQRLVMKGMMRCPPMIPEVVRMIPFRKFPLQIPFGGEVSAGCGVSECRISDPYSRDESI
jgi:hypothetical protein